MINIIIRNLHTDALFYASLKSPGVKITTLRLLTTILSDRGLWFLTFHRIAYACQHKRQPRNPAWWIARLLQSIGMYMNAFLCKSEILSNCEVTGPIYFSSKGYYMCGAQKIGRGSIIHHHVTFGRASGTGELDSPIIGENVWIGPDCIIAGKLEIGHDATLLPGSYLTFSVPARSVVKGNPARVICRDFDNSSLRNSLTVVQEVLTVSQP